MDIILEKAFWWQAFLHWVDGFETGMKTEIRRLPAATGDILPIYLLYSTSSQPECNQYIQILWKCSLWSGKAARKDKVRWRWGVSMKKATTFAAKNQIETGWRRHLCRIIRRRCQCIYQFDKTPSIAQFEKPAANASSRPPSVLFYFVPQEKGQIFPSPEYPPFLAVNLTVNYTIWSLQDCS